MYNTGWTNDDDVFAEMDTNLGADYAWMTGPNVSGGTLSFKSESIAREYIYKYLPREEIDAILRL
jgi:hypothetical protein